MALKQINTAPATPFEEEAGVVGTVVTERDTSATTEPEVSLGQAVKAEAAASTAIADTKVMPPASGKFNGGSLKEFQDAIPLEMRETIGFSAVPVITVDSGGGFWINKTEKKLGDTIKVDLISFNLRWVITPGADDDEATEHVRYSSDGVTIDTTGESVTDYIRNLREVEGYKKAAKKAYIDLWVELVEANGAVIAPEERETYKVQLSPQSVDEFQFFQLKRGVKESRGLLPPLKLLVLSGTRRTGKENTWGVIKFSAE